MHSITRSRLFRRGGLLAGMIALVLLFTPINVMAVTVTVGPDTTVSAADATYVPTAFDVDPELASVSTEAGAIGSAPNTYFLYAVPPVIDTNGFDFNTDAAGQQLAASESVTLGNPSFPNAFDMQDPGGTINDQNSVIVRWGGQYLINSTGDDFLVAEQGSSDGPELYLVRVKPLGAPLTDFYYEPAEAFLDHDPATDNGNFEPGQFITLFDLDDFGVAPNGYVEYIEIVNATTTQRSSFDSSGQGFINQGSTQAIVEGSVNFPDVTATTYDDTKLDADLAYTIALGGTQLGVPIVYNSNPAPGSTVDLSGTAATNPQTATIDVSNIAPDDGSQLDVSQVSISPGYTVTGLPIIGLTPADAAVTLTVSCDAPQAPGTLVVQTNEPGEPQYTYNLLCEDTTVVPTPEPTEPPPSDGGDPGPGDTGGDTGAVAELPESVEQLPTTGESPMWRDALLALVAGLLALGTAGTLYMRRQ